MTRTFLASRRMDATSAAPTCSTAARRTTAATSAPTAGTWRSARWSRSSGPRSSRHWASTPTSTPSPYDPAQWAACAQVLTDDVRDQDPRRVGRDLRAAGRLRRPGAHAGRGAGPSAQRRSRLVRQVGDATLARARAEVLGDPRATAAPLTEMDADTAALLAEAGYTERRGRATARRRRDRLNRAVQRSLAATAATIGTIGRQPVDRSPARAAENQRVSS